MTYLACRPAELAWTRQRRGGLVAVGVTANEITLREGLNMQPPKEQYSKSAVMDNETPLLVLKPSPSKIRCGLFFGSILFAATLYVLFKGINDGRIATCVIFCFLAVFYLAMIIDMLVTKSFNLYSDRAEKSSVFGKKVVYLKGAKVSMVISRYYTRFSWLHVIPESSCWYDFWEGIKYNLDHGDRRADANKIVDSFKSIGIELEDKDASVLNEKYEQI